MSEVNKPTRWAYAVYGPKTFGLGEAGEGAFFQIRCMYGDVKMQENIEAMEFIWDAKRIHHETGLTPRQLVVQRDVLEAALSEMCEFFAPNAWGSSDNRRDALNNAEAALALVKGEPK